MMDFSECQMNFRICVEHMNNHFPFRPNSKLH